MIFSLEALQARHGDALLLHVGPTEAPHVLLIDGGPSGVYHDAVEPRLQDIRSALSSSVDPDLDPLPLSMIMISHMDSDHVAGVLELLDDMERRQSNNEPLPFDVRHMWFNTFDDIVGNVEVADAAQLVADASEPHVAAVVASTAEGRRLRNAAERLGALVNNPFEPDGDLPALVRGDVDQEPIAWDGGVTLDVLHPDAKRLKSMQRKWDRDLRDARKKGDTSIVAGLTRRDSSAFNLASIVCLAELDGKSMLLTGDARGDDILDGLERAGRLDDDGRIHVDILKLPHHGSDRNVSTAFFQAVTADHYLISADGKHHNPDKATLAMLSQATTGRDDFTIHLTNRAGKHDLQDMLDGFFQSERDKGRTYGVQYRESDSLSMRIDLLDPLDY